MTFSIIIPSFNQEKYIRSTLENVIELKRSAGEKSIEIEILLFDNNSNDRVRQVISEYAHQLNHIEIKNDKGQYDAINKGIERCKGEYWTWLNTDDLIDLDGFFKLATALKSNPQIDYIYGDVNYIDENNKYLFTNKAKQLSLKTLVHYNPGIFQPGSFFKTAFTNKVGLLNNYRCCFDYEYVLRCLKNNAVIYCCNFPVACFRYYNDSKTGMIIPVFINEQLQISEGYGRTIFSFLTWFSHLRLLKHKLFPRK